MVHARALRLHPGPAQPWRRARLAAEGAVRLHRVHGRLRVFIRARAVAGRRREHRLRPLRNAAGRTAKNLHPRHAPRAARRGRLERRVAARRPRAERVDGQQLDRCAALPADAALCGGFAARRRSRPRGRTGRTCGEHARRFQPPSHPRRGCRRLRYFQPGWQRVRTSPSPVGQEDGHRLFAHPDDLRHFRRTFHRGASAGALGPHPQPSALPRRRKAHG